MTYFEMNGSVWSVIDVPDESSILVDRTGRKTVAVTDPSVHTIFMSSNLHGYFRQKVLIHEMGHCLLVSYDLITDIHRWVRPSDWIEVEEWICNLFANYGLEVFANAYAILGDDAMKLVPKRLEELL